MLLLCNVETKQCSVAVNQSIFSCYDYEYCYVTALLLLRYFDGSIGR